GAKLPNQGGRRRARRARKRRPAVAQSRTYFRPRPGGRRGLLRSPLARRSDFHRPCAGVFLFDQARADAVAGNRARHRTLEFRRAADEGVANTRRKADRRPADGADRAGQEGQARQAHLYSLARDRKGVRRAGCRSVRHPELFDGTIGRPMSAVTLNLLVAFLLLAANAFYVAAEFALVKSRGYRINTLAKRNSFGARMAQHMLQNIEAYLACCQLGITMASLGLGWVGEPTVSSLLAPLLEPLGLPEQALHFTSFMIGFLVFSSLHIVIGEQVPKTFAIRQPEPVSQWIAYPLYCSFILFYPLNWLLNVASRGILRLLGVREASHQEILSGPEIEGLVEASAEHGSIPEGEAEYIQNVFRLAELEVSDVMMHRTEMVTINVDDPPADIVKAALDSAVTRIPLWREKPENIVGMLHAKDLLRALQDVGG